MSHLMDAALATCQRMQERRAAPPPDRPATRADAIVAEGDKRRIQYRRDNPNADTAMVYGAQVGYLHAQVRKLDAELAALQPAYRHDLYKYVRLYVPALGGLAECGYTASGWAGHVHVDLAQVWVNGRDIAAGISKELAQVLIERLQAMHLEAGE